MPEITFDDFRGGLWIPDEAAPSTEQAGFAVPANALLQADNVDFLPSGGVRGRRGSTLYSATPLGGPVTMLRRYYGRPVPAEAFGKPVGRQLDLVGSSPWVNQTAIEQPFGEQASAALVGGTQTVYLVALAPFFHDPIPADAVITGILAQVATFGGPASFLPVEASIRLIRDGVADGADKSTGAAVGLTIASTAYGGAGDLWGATWTADDINSPGFGVGVSFADGGGAGVVRVDYIAVTVYFSAAEATTFLAAHTAGASLTYSRGAAGTFSPIPGGSLVNPLRRPRAVAWPQKGKVFFFDGVNPVTEYNGVEMVETGADALDGVVLLPPRKGPFACLHKNRLYAGDPGEPSSVYACDVNDETRWRPVVQLAVNDDRGGRLTGLESFGDGVLIFKDTSLWRFLGDPEFGGSLVQLAQVGCIAPASVAVTPFGVVFVGREGVWLTDGNSLVPLSAPIRSLFVDRSSQRTYPDAVGVYYPRRDQYVLHLDPAAGGPGYVLHRIATPAGDGSEGQLLAWSRIPGLPMNCGAVWDGQGDAGELYLGDRQGYVWLRDVGEADFLLGYTSEIVTAQRLLDRSRAMGRANAVRPIFRSQTSLAMGLRYDQVDTDDVTINVGASGPEPTIQEPRRYVADKAAFGRFLSLHAAAVSGPQFELHRVDVDVRLRGPRVWR